MCDKCLFFYNITNKNLSVFVWFKEQSILCYLNYFDGDGDTAAGRIVSFKAETCRTELQLLHLLHKSQVFCCTHAKDSESISELVVLYRK